jgi:O-methyltransferase involved in polyketide biosynthesis
VVIIAAGFDTRAYRLGRPGVAFYEVDLPHASDKKRELVETLLPADQVGGAGRAGRGEGWGRGAGGRR